MFASTTGSSVSRHAARIGSAPFLLPAARTRPLSGCPPSITNDSAAASLTTVVDKAAGIVAAALEPTREQAWATLTEYTKSEALLRHALAVEASTAFYARQLRRGRGAVARHGAAARLRLRDAPHARQASAGRRADPARAEGYPEVVIEAVLSHAEHLAMPRDTPLKRTLFACDELSGFVHACGLVRPTGLDGLEPKSVRKKLKQPSFAAGVHRDEVYAGAELLGLELDEHIANVVAALQPIAPELGLRTAADAA